MMNLKGKRVGLVLSGGGAKGIYQVGMLKAFEEHGLEKENLVMAGTSIGAMNALLYACGDLINIREFIAALGKEFIGFADIPLEGDQPQKRREVSDRLMNKFYPDELIEKNTIPVIACVYSSGTKKPEYMKLNGLSGKEQRDITLASGSIPGLLPSVPYKDVFLSDGAVLPIEYKALAEPDKIPLVALKDEDLDIIIISYLKPEDKVDISIVKPGVEVIEIRPEKPLEYMPGTGTLDFSAERLKISEEQGYRETKEFLEKYKGN